MTAMVAVEGAATATTLKVRQTTRQVVDTVVPTGLALSTRHRHQPRRREVATGLAPSRPVTRATPARPRAAATDLAPPRPVMPATPARPRAAATGLAPSRPVTRATPVRPRAAATDP